MKKRTRFIAAIGAVAAIGTGVAATSGPTAGAQAIPVLCPIIIGDPVPPDPIRISLVNFDFGSGGLVDREPAGCGTVTWDRAGNTITPRLTGTLYAKNSLGTTVRMTMVHRDVDGDVLATARQPAQEIASDFEEIPVNLGNYANPATYQVDVELQQLVADVWETKGLVSAYIGSANKAPDLVRVLGVGEDFGTGNFSGGDPTGSGTLTWDLADETISPHLEGELYLNNAAGTRAQVRMTYFDVHGNQLGSRAGGLGEPLVNGLQRFDVDFGSSFSDYRTYKVEVTIEVDVFGTWDEVAGPVTVTI